jgi:hypothetical protein
MEKQKKPKEPKAPKRVYVVYDFDGPAFVGKTLNMAREARWGLAEKIATYLLKEK